MDDCYFVYEGKRFDNLDEVIDSLSRALEENRDNIVNEAKNVYTKLMKIASNKQYIDYTNGIIKFDIDKEDIENIYFNLQNQPVSFGIYSDLRKTKELLYNIEIKPTKSNKCLKKLAEYKKSIDELIAKFTAYRNAGIINAAIENNMGKLILFYFLSSIKEHVDEELSKIKKYLSENSDKKVYNILMERKYQLDMFSKVDDNLGLRLGLEALAILVTFPQNAEYMIKLWERRY